MLEINRESIQAWAFWRNKIYIRWLYSKKNKKTKIDMKIKNAIILAAGFGKRLNPLTLKMPKPLLKIGDITLLENTINLLKNYGI